MCATGLPPMSWLASRSVTVAQPAKASGVEACHPQSAGFSGASAGRITGAVVGVGTGVEVAVTVGADWLGVADEQAAATRIRSAAAPANLLTATPLRAVSNTQTL